MFDNQEEFLRLAQRRKLKELNNIDDTKEVADLIQLLANTVSQEEWEEYKALVKRREGIFAAHIPELSPFPLKVIEQLIEYTDSLLQRVEKEWQEEHIFTWESLEEFKAVGEKYFTYSSKILGPGEKIDNTINFDIDPERYNTDNAEELIPDWIKAYKTALDALKKALNANNTCAAASICMNLWGMAFSLQI